MSVASEVHITPFLVIILVTYNLTLIPTLIPNTGNLAPLLLFGTLYLAVSVHDFFCFTKAPLFVVVYHTHL